MTFVAANETQQPQNSDTFSLFHAACNNLYLLASVKSCSIPRKRKYIHIPYIYL